MRKTITSLYVEPELLQLCKQRDINISQTFNDLLRSFLGQKQQRTIKDIQKDLNSLQIRYETDKIVLQNELSKAEAAEKEEYNKERAERKKKLLRERGIYVD